MRPLLSGFGDELVKLGANPELDVDIDKAMSEAAIDQNTVNNPYSVGEALSNLRGEGREVSRDYLASMLIGATAFPLAAAFGNKFNRALKNKSVMRAMRGKRFGKRRLANELETGKTFGAYKPGRPSREQPALTHHEALGAAARGGLYGSGVQMVRDRFSGAAGVNDD